MPSRLLTTLLSHHRLMDGLLLGSLVLIHLVVTVVWLGQDDFDLYRVEDEMAHYWGLSNLHAAMSLDPLAGVLNGLRAVHSQYSLLVHLPRATAGLLFGATPLVFCLANGVYLVVLLVSVYLIGRQCHGRGAGLLAAALVSLTPAAYGGLRSVGLDFPVTCMTALAMLALLRADGFRRLPAAAGFGVCAGLAILVKGQAVLFLIWPAALALVRALWQQRRRGEALWRPLAGGALAVGLVLATTAVWWGGRLTHMLGFLSAHASGQGMRDISGDISLWGGVLCYLQALPLALSAPLALGALLTLPLFWRRARHRWVMLAWLVLPLLLHMALSVRHPRYIFPLAPAAVVVLAVGVCTLRPRLRAAAAGASAALALVAWLSCSWLQHPEPGIIRPLRCYFQIPIYMVRTPDTINNLLACGTQKFAGPPAVPRRSAHHQTAQRLVQYLRQQGPKDRPILIYSDEVSWVAPAAEAVRRAMPSVLFLDVLHAGVLLPHKPDHTRETFVLWRADRPPPPVPGVAHALGSLSYLLAEDIPGQLVLYRFEGRATNWPHLF